jgi:hypothetical protein
MNRIEVPLPNGNRIVAELMEGSDQIAIGIADANDNYLQDLVVVEPAPNECSNISVKSDSYNIYVYADENDECYTDKFTVDQYKGA